MLQAGGATRDCWAAAAAAAAAATQARAYGWLAWCHNPEPGVEVADEEDAAAAAATWWYSGFW